MFYGQLFQLLPFTINAVAGLSAILCSQSSSPVAQKGVRIGRCSLWHSSRRPWLRRRSAQEPMPEGILMLATDGDGVPVALEPCSTIGPLDRQYRRH